MALYTYTHIYIYIYIYIYMCVCQECDKVHRYTIWIGGSHTSSNLSHLLQFAAKGCDPCLALYWVQGDAGSDLPN